LLPFFYIREYDSTQQYLILDEDNSRHVVQALRMKPGEQMLLTDGKGTLITAAIANDHKKHCSVSVLNTSLMEPQMPDVTIAISLTKNLSRFEWFLEKATELGVRRIVPIICHRTEKQRFKEERFHNILVSAMLQSQQCYLPEMPTPQQFEKVFEETYFQDISNKYIAHCLEEDKQTVSYSFHPSIIFIGPEGDFTPEEIAFALHAGCKPVSLGETRLRTETAGMVASTLLRVNTH